MNAAARFTTEAIARMLPGAKVFGGSFHSSLPPFHAIPAERRPVILHEARGAYMAALFHEANLPFPIPHDDHGAPIWPPHITGSISHKGTIALIAIGGRSDFECIGVDVELVGARDARIRDLVGDERPHSDLTHAQASALNFSAKEAAFKALYHLDGGRRSFKELELNWAPDGKSCTPATRPDLRIAVEWDWPWIVAAASLPAISRMDSSLRSSAFGPP